MNHSYFESKGKEEGRKKKEIRETGKNIKIEKRNRKKEIEEIEKK